MDFITRLVDIFSGNYYRNQKAIERDLADLELKDDLDYACVQYTCLDENDKEKQDQEKKILYLMKKAGINSHRFSVHTFISEGGSLKVENCPYWDKLTKGEDL